MLPSSYKLWSNLLVILFIIAACSEIPQPFKPNEKLRSELNNKELNKYSSISVSKIHGFDGDQNDPLTYELVKALIRNGVIATIDSISVSSMILESKFNNGIISWRLFDPTGGVLLTGDKPYTHYNDFFVVANEIAAMIATKIGARPDHQSIALNESIYLTPIIGSVDKKNNYLFKSMQNVLKANQLNITNDLKPAKFIISGSIHLDTIDFNMKSITVEWTIMRDNGTKIGVVTQKNILPIIQFRKKWAIISKDIANKAAYSVINLILRSANSLKN